MPRARGTTQGAAPRTKAARRATLEGAVGDGRLASLEALRDRLARELDECSSARDIAALSLRFTDVLAQIDELRTPTEVGNDTPPSPVDEFTRARQERARKAGRSA